LSFLTLCVLVLATAVAGCESAKADGGEAADPSREVTSTTTTSTPGEENLPTNGEDAESRLATGLQVYREQFCGTCHELGSAGTSGRFGPTHNGIGAIAEERIHAQGYSGSASTAEEYIRESLLEPGIYRAPGFERTRFAMPAYTHLSEADLDAIVQLLLRERRDN
jgi:mono/diheme cytochrome c family protein